MEFRVSRMCEVLEVSRSGYYDWCGRGESRRNGQDKILIKQIRIVHESHKEAYGTVKTWLALNEVGIICGKHRVARLRSIAGIETRRRRRFRLAYNARHSAPPAPNLLRQCFEAPGPDQVWMADITFGVALSGGSGGPLLSAGGGLVNEGASYAGVGQ